MERSGWFPFEQKTNGGGTLGSSFTQPISQRKQMGKEHWAVPSSNLSICENQHSWTRDIWPAPPQSGRIFCIWIWNWIHWFFWLKNKNWKILFQIYFFEVYAPANIPWPSDVDRFFAWQMREMQRIFVHLQNVLNAGKTQKTSFLNFSDLRKKGDGFCLIQTINNALGGQTFSPNDAKKKTQKTFFSWLWSQTESVESNELNLIFLNMDNFFKNVGCSFVLRRWEKYFLKAFDHCCKKVFTLMLRFQKHEFSSISSTEINGQHWKNSSCQTLEEKQSNLFYFFFWTKIPLLTFLLSCPSPKLALLKYGRKKPFNPHFNFFRSNIPWNV